jgi:SagB-type dehydrogenase family enzyme
MDPVEKHREFLKGDIRDLKVVIRSDQTRGLPPPPVQKPLPEGASTVQLPDPLQCAQQPADLPELIGARRSRRRFTDQALDMDELSFLLWATQGVNEAGAEGGFERGTFRTVPSAGARHALETYVVASRVDGLVPGIYRYLPLDHALAVVRQAVDLEDDVTDACLGQSFAGRSAAVFAWTAVPYRCEWRYGVFAHKLIALDAGHVCQNLYLACESIGAGTCAIAAYDHGKMDAMLRVDGKDEFTVYLAPVGKVADLT